MSKIHNALRYISSQRSPVPPSPNKYNAAVDAAAQYNFELYGWYMCAVALVVVVKWHEIEPAFNRWHRKITSPKAVHADKDAVAKARARQQQVTQLAARQAAKERAIKEREAILNQREKKKQATGEWCHLQPSTVLSTSPSKYNPQ